MWRYGRGRGTYKAGEREAVPEPGHWCLEVAGLEVLVAPLRLHGSIHVRPDERDGAPRDPAALVRDLDRDVLLALDDDDLDRRELVFPVVAVALDHGAQRVLEQFEADVRQVSRDVGKVQVFGADELYRRTLEHRIVFFADETRVFDRFVHDVVDVLL